MYDRTEAADSPDARNESGSPRKIENRRLHLFSY